MQRSADQVGSGSRRGQPRPFLPVRSQHGLDRAGRQVAAKLHPRRAVAVPRTFDARIEVTPGDHCQGDRMTPQHAMREIVSWDDVEQPGRR
jgi:hypothetical protein